MGLWKSISQRIRQGADAAAEAIGPDAVTKAGFNIEDSKKQIAGFRRSIAEFMAQNKQIERQAEAAKADVQKWDGIAKKAAAASNADDARTALTNKQQAQQRRDAFLKDIKKNQGVIDHQRKTIAAAEAKIQQADSDKSMLKARSDGAKARKGLAAAQASFNSGDNPLGALDDLRKSVEADEAEAEAYEELSGVGEESLDDKYGGGGDASVDAELEKLMAGSKK